MIIRTINTNINITNLLSISSKQSGSKSNIIKPNITINEKPNENVTSLLLFFNITVIIYPIKNDKPESIVTKHAILIKSLPWRLYHKN